MTNFLHGIEIIEVSSGGRTITTPATSVIGLVGTAFSNNEEANPINTILPINKPVLFTNIRQLKDLGLSNKGTIPTSLMSIYNQASAIVVVIRVSEGVNQTDTIKNLAGSSADYTGVYALMSAESVLKYKPKILVCPYFSSLVNAENKPNAIVNSLTDVAEKLRAVALIDGTNTTVDAVVSFGSELSNSRAMIIDPSYKPNFVMDGADLTNYPTSPLLAGVIAKNDAQKGFWWSPSNTEVKGISTLVRPISFALSDPSTDSNIMNHGGITTIIFSNGMYKIWGNRSTSKDNQWHFISVRRTIDTVYDALENSMQWALGRPFSKQLFSDIENNIQTYLNQLISQGALLGGRVWVDQDANSVETYNQGQLIVSFDLEPPASVERLTFKAYRNSEYIEELFSKDTN